MELIVSVTISTLEPKRVREKEKVCLLPGTSLKKFFRNRLNAVFISMEVET